MIQRIFSFVCFSIGLSLVVWEVFSDSASRPYLMIFGMAIMAPSMARQIENSVSHTQIHRSRHQKCIDDTAKLERELGIGQVEEPEPDESQAIADDAVKMEIIAEMARQNGQGSWPSLAAELKRNEDALRSCQELQVIFDPPRLQKVWR